jgi:uncharacterized LabA/DUF88 family protein
MIFLDWLSFADEYSKNSTTNAFPDLSRLATYLEGEREGVARMVYSDERLEPHRRLIEDRHGFRLIARQSERHDKKTKEVTVALAAQMVHQTFRRRPDDPTRSWFDIVILVSNNRDFAPALDYVRVIGGGVEVACLAPDALPPRLRHVAHVVRDLRPAI